MASLLPGVASSMQGVASSMAAAELVLGSALGSGLASGGGLLVGSPTSWLSTSASRSGQVETCTVGFPDRYRLGIALQPGDCARLQAVNSVKTCTAGPLQACKSSLPLWSKPDLSSCDVLISGPVCCC